MDFYYQIQIDVKQAEEPMEEDFYAQMLIMYLYDNGATGIEERDNDTFMEWGKYEAPEKDEIRIIASFDENFNIELFLPELKKYIEEMIEGFDLSKISYAKYNNENWIVEWKKYFKPIEITETLVVKPEWEKYDAKENQIVININPDMAFGTGHHETTAIALTLLETELRKKNNIKEIIDIGTGSGILAITASKLQDNLLIDAIDIDKKALKIAQEQIELNNVENVIILNELANDIFKSYDLIIANILASVLIQIKNDIIRLLNKDGIVILSGIMLKDEKSFMKNFIEGNFEIIQRIKKGEWIGFSVKHI